MRSSAGCRYSAGVPSVVHIPALQRDHYCTWYHVSGTGTGIISRTMIGTTERVGREHVSAKRRSTPTIREGRRTCASALVLHILVPGTAYLVLQ